MASIPPGKTFGPLIGDESPRPPIGLSHADPALDLAWLAFWAFFAECLGEAEPTIDCEDLSNRWLRNWFPRADELIAKHLSFGAEAGGPFNPVVLFEKKRIISELMGFFPGAIENGDTFFPTFPSLFNLIQLLKALAQQLAQQVIDGIDDQQQFDLDMHHLFVVCLEITKIA